MRRFGWVIVLVAVFGAWQLWVDVRGVPSYLLPSPSAILSTLWDERSSLASDALHTLGEMLAGFALALVTGLGAATLLYRWRTLRRAFYPLLTASQSVPLVALAPLLVVYLGFGLAPKLVVIALVCFFPITVGAIDGFEGVDPEYRRMMLTLHASEAAIFRRVEFPAALPSIFSGARVAASYTAVAALFAEFVGSSSGLGFTIREATDQYDSALVGVAVLLLALLALLLFWGVGLVQRTVAPWSRRRV
jgi:putative hydroxymethylpyrimidine transport system permease protein